MQIPYRDENVSSFADGVPFGVAPQRRRQHIIIESPPDENGGLGIKPQGFC